MAVLKAAERNALPEDQFLMPEERKLPVHDRGHWMSARGRIFNVKGISAARRKQLIARWEERGREKGWLKTETLSDMPHEGHALTGLWYDYVLAVDMFHHIEELEELVEEGMHCACTPELQAALPELYASIEQVEAKLLGWLEAWGDALMQQPAPTAENPWLERAVALAEDGYHMLADFTRKPVGLTPPPAARKAFARGLKLYEEGRGGDGLQPATIRWARKVVAGEALTEEKLRKMNAWFARHAVDKRPGWDKAGEETPGFVAWLLWGGDAARDWAKRKVDELDRLVGA
jgi:hypothetical protein